MFSHHAHHFNSHATVSAAFANARKSVFQDFHGSQRRHLWLAGLGCNLCKTNAKHRIYLRFLEELDVFCPWLLSVQHTKTSLQSTEFAKNTFLGWLCSLRHTGTSSPNRQRSLSLSICRLSCPLLRLFRKRPSCQPSSVNQNQYLMKGNQESHDSYFDKNHSNDNASDNKDNETEFYVRRHACAPNIFVKGEEKK